MIEEYISKLNNEQRLAVETIDGPVLIIAGPGTGKTQMLAVRIANILQKTDAGPANILCLTFTESGAAAMRSRLLKIIGKDAYSIKINTFHSFCNDVIQNFPDKFSFSKDLIQLDDLNKIKIIKEIIDSLQEEEKVLQLRPFYNPYKYQNQILSAIQTLKREGITLDKFKDKVNEDYEELKNNPDINPKTGKPKTNWAKELKKAEKNLELSIFYQKYNEKLEEKGMYDYEDMLLFVIEKFKVDEEVLAFYQEKFLYILVDEFQDSNGAQNEIIKYLGSFDRSPNVFAVGDDDQAIYRFQGANLENLLFFERQFENVKTILVTTNYRSSQHILDLAGSVIDNNQTRLSKVFPNIVKKLKAGTNRKNHKAQVFEFSTFEKENIFLAKKIKELAGKGVKYSDIAIFYRTHNDSHDIIETLLKSDIPIKLAAGKNSLEEPIVGQFLNLLKIVQFEAEEVEKLIFKALFYQFFNLNRLDVFKLVAYVKEKNRTYSPEQKRYKIFDVISSKEELINAGIESVDQIFELSQKILKWRSDAENMPLIKFVENLGTESGLIRSVFSKEDNIEEINALNSLYRYIKEIQKSSDIHDLSSLLENINLLNENKIAISEKEIDTDSDAVNLMTAHKAKGLEFKHVFIVKCFDKNWGNRGENRTAIKLPSFAEEVERKLGDDIDYDIEDERRLFYVALTRAEENLYISYAKEYPTGNSTKIVGASQFIQELDQSLVEYPSTLEYEDAEIEIAKTLMSPVARSPFTISEKEFLAKVVKDYKLSASALNEYLQCPLKFKFNRLLRVPQPYNRDQSLGTAVHSALENYFRELKQDKKNDKSYLLFVFEKALERTLLSNEDFKETLIEGKKILSDYFDKYSENFIKPLQIEYKFNSRDILLESDRTEPICITGTIDKIEPIDEDNHFVRVVDYKTSTPKSENEIKGLNKNSTGDIYRQLMFYKILGDCDNNFKTNFNSPKYNIVELQADFLKPDGVKKEFKKISLPIIEEDIHALKEQIVDVIISIRNLEFFGTEKYPLCEKCEWCNL